MTDQSLVTDHYGNQPLREQVRHALAAAGLPETGLDWRKLASLDQFHGGGLPATLALAAMLDLTPDQTVLDIGSGLGGPARTLAATYGCHVTGVDLTAPYVDLATMLSERTGLADKTVFQVADALALPFADESFDLAWTQHVGQNIEDKSAFYREIARVLKPGGRLALFDQLQGEAGPVIFPVPWAKTPATSWLLTPEELEQILIETGFEIATSVDATDQVNGWFEARRASANPGESALGPQVVMGEEFPEMMASFERNIREGRVVFRQMIAVRR